jgi:hypothetical protein
MSMSDYTLDVEELMYEEQGLMQIEREHQEHLEALHYIEEFQAIVENEENYADLIEAENKIVEYQEVYVNYKDNSTDELRTKIESLGQIIVDLAHKLKEQANQIPISEKKLITVKDFETLYSIAEESQRKLRGRLNDPLPFTQLTARGTVLYNCEEIDKWLENYKKERN